MATTTPPPTAVETICGLAEIALHFGQAIGKRTSWDSDTGNATVSYELIRLH